VTDVLPATATDDTIVEWARRDGRAIITQDLDFTAIVALSGRTQPSIVSIRLSSSRVETVNATLDRVLPTIDADVAAGALVTIEDTRVRSRRLPLV
jgi:predicted nuclease of predicted toxin-antitoxin system